MENNEFESYVQKRVNTICASLGFYREQLNIINETSKLRNLTLDELNRETEIRKTIFKLEKELEEIRKNQKEVSKEATEEKTNTKSNNGDGTRVFVGVCALLLATSIFYSAVSRNKNNTLSADTTFTPAPITTSTPLVTASPVITANPNLKLGEPGTFFDPTNKEQVSARAQYILDNNINNIVAKIDNIDAPEITTNDIVSDIIRFSNGVDPLYYEEISHLKPGEYDTETKANDYAQLRAEIFANYPGDFGDLDKMYHSHFDLLFIDDSSMAKFVDAYDGVYNEIADERNAKNIELAREKIKVLTTMLYEDFVLRGEKINTEYSPNVQRGNPYNFTGNFKFGISDSALTRWSSYVTELSGNGNNPICVPLCKDPETGEYRLINVEEVYVAITEGKGKNIKLSYYNDYYEDEKNEPFLMEVEFFNDLVAVLNKQIENKKEAQNDTQLTESTDRARKLALR